MSGSDLTHAFSPRVRQRGAEYYRSGLVRITAHTPDLIRATVRGNEAYQVRLALHKPRLLMSCTCPFYDSDGPCKHLWATVLAGRAQGLLGALSAWKDLAIELRSPNDSLTDEAPVDLDVAENETAVVEAPRPLGGPPARPRPTSVSASAPTVPVADWKRLLAQANLVESEPDPARMFNGELLYVVDIAATVRDDLALVVLERTPKKDGSWSKPRAPLIARDALATLPDRRDRRLLPLIEAAGTLTKTAHTTIDYRTHQRCFPTSVDLPLALADTVMPLVASTGRFFVQRRPQAELERASYDDGAPWDFILRLERRRDGTGSEVTGVLARGDERIDLSVPLLTTSTGWVVIGSSIGHLRHFGAFGILTLLRRQQRLQLPAADEKPFLELLFAHPALPRLELPASFALREVDSVPRPKLRLFAGRDPAWSREAIAPTADLSFVYEGKTIAVSDRRAMIAHVDAGILIRRNFEAEAAAQSRLLELGFEIRRVSTAHAAPLETGGFSVRVKDLPTVIRALLADQWIVEANGRMYRNAGPARVSVGGGGPGGGPGSGIDWFDLDARIDFDGVSASLPELLRAQRRGEGTIILSDGTLGLVPEEWLAKYGFLAEMGSVEGDNVRFRRSQTGLLDALLSAEPEVSFDKAFVRVRKELRRFDGVKPEQAPRSFSGELRPYQEVGLGWLAFLRRFGFGGCLADDMGLGKTVQVLAMLAGRKPKTKRPSLVVVPKSLLWNWQHEATRFAPKLRVLAHAGTDRARTAEALGKFDLVVTTYGILRSDIMLLREIVFDHLILDEAQTIKNADSESAKAARLLKGDHRLALSGTPIENHLGELWSLFEFLNPGLLGSARAFEGTIKKGRPTPETIEILRKAVRPFMLRRTKEEVAPELPPKHEETLLCELEPRQQKLYDELRDHYRAKLIGKPGTLSPAASASTDPTGAQPVAGDGGPLGAIQLPVPAGVSTTAESPGGMAGRGGKIQVLEALLRLRQAACHPGLIDESRLDEPSAKLDVLLPRLREVREEGHKALVFSQFTSFLAIVRRALDAENVPYEYLDGSTENRQERVNRFQDDPACPFFLISLKAGGVGLNLTAADYVFILDPWWNPAVEAQAIDRAHRIGQTKHVFVYRLLCRGTVEEKVAALQESKRDLAASIITDSQSLIRDLDRETLEMLLT